MVFIVSPNNIWVNTVGNQWFTWLSCCEIWNNQDRKGLSSIISLERYIVTLSTCGFHICEFAYLLNLLITPKPILVVFSQTYWERHKKIWVAQGTCGTWSQTRTHSVSWFSSHIGDLCPFHSLFSATIFAFLLVISPFKMAPTPSAELLFSVPKHKKTDVPHRENVS